MSEPMYIVEQNGEMFITGRALRVTEVVQPYQDGKAGIAALMRRFDLSAAEVHAAIAFCLDPTVWDSLRQDGDTVKIGDVSALSIAFTHRHAVRSLEDTAERHHISTAQVHAALSHYYTRNPDEDNLYDVNMHDISMKSLDQRASSLPGISALTSIATISVVNLFAATVFVIGSVAYGVNNPDVVRGWLESLGLNADTIEEEIRSEHEERRAIAAQNMTAEAPQMQPTNFLFAETDIEIGGGQETITCTLIVASDAGSAWIREDPGTAYAHGAEGVENGERLTADAYCRSSYDLPRWYRVEGGYWIREDVVRDRGQCNDLQRINTSRCNNGDNAPPAPQPQQQTSSGSADFDCAELARNIEAYRSASSSGSTRGDAATAAGLNDLLNMWAQECSHLNTP